MKLSIVCWGNSIFRNLLFLISLMWIILVTFTSLSLEASVIPSYVLFSLAFVANLIFSLSFFINFGRGSFYLLLSAMFFIGFLIKFSLHTIFDYAYVEPIGAFTGSEDELICFFSVSTIGALALLMAQLFSAKIVEKKLSHFKREIIPELSFKKKIGTYLVLLSIAIVLSVINLEKNIMLFGLLPSVSLPLKGNVIYFLLLTRGILFTFFYFLTKDFKRRWILLGALLCLICSVGVLSKMILIIYFSVVILLLLANWQSIERPVTKLAVILVALLSFSFINVLATIQLRNDIYAKFAVEKPMESVSILIAKTSEAKGREDTESQEKDTSKIKSPAIESKLQRYSMKFLSLFVERWIGTEGVMAVLSYKEIGLELFYRAWSEEGYRGKPIYKKISNPEHYDFVLKNQEKMKISTSVSGPIAFFYYSGSYAVVFFGIFLLGLFLSTIESLVGIVVVERSVSFYVGTILAFDFFQFGISPLSFFKYLVFTIVCILFFSEYFRRINAPSKLKG